MPNNCFFKIDGGNGATFFLSAASFADWKKSLEFYQGVSWLAKVKKQLLTAAYCVMKCKAKTSADEVVAALYKVLPDDVAFTLGEHDSAMISPTRDKVVIHHHGQSYEKFAVSASRDGVARELEFYHLLQEKKPQSFCFSNIEAGQSDARCVHFKMAYAPRQKARREDLPLEVYREFFDLKREADVSWACCWDRLALPVEIPAAFREGTTPVGAVHRDFKPWNVKLGKKVQLFDFESVSSGLPLEDFFNYFVDPALHFGSVRECLITLREQKLWEQAQKLLIMQGISPTEVDRYWKYYLLERYDHFDRAGAPALAKKFLALYHEKPPAEVSLRRAVFEVAGIVLLAALIRLWYAWCHPLESNDGIRYLSWIRQWVSEGSCESLLVRPPLFFYLARGLMACGLSAENATLAINLAAGSLLVIPVYLAGRALWKKHFSGIAAAFFCAVMPKLVKFSCVRLRDGVYLFFIGWVIAFWAWAFQAENDRRGVWSAFFCGLAMALGVMCRFEMLEFLPWVVLTLPILALCICRSWRCALLFPLMVLLGLAVGIVGISILPGMPPVWQSYLNRIRMQFWMWKLWGLR